MVKELLWTGERYLPNVEGDVQIEHMHRYFVALKLVRDKNVLDIACGEGYGSNLLADEALSVTGIDISSDAIEHARLKYAKENLRFLQGDCTAIPLANNSVDVVVSFETIEHHDKHKIFLHEIKRVLKPEGLLIISSPDKKEYTDLTGHDNQFHVKELYLSEFEKLIQENFKQHTMLGQRIKYGSLIAPLKDIQSSTFVNYKTDHKGIAHEENSIFNPLYFLALASDSKLPSPWYGLYEHPVENSEPVRSLTNTLRSKSEAFDALADESERLSAEHSTLSAKYLTMKNEHALLLDKAEQLKTELTNRDIIIEELLNSTSWHITKPIRWSKNHLTLWKGRVRARWSRLKNNGFGFKPLKAGFRVVKNAGGAKNVILKLSGLLWGGNLKEIKETAKRLAKSAKDQEQYVTLLSSPTKAEPSLFDYSFAANNTPAEFSDYKIYPPIDTDIRLIAFYLPQFHPIEENDEAWGKGFTEWTNVSKAIPQFSGHYQPKLPSELGFYDLRLDAIHKRQIELAKNYGIHGFCYHYYWFDGKKVLDTPIKRILSNPELDFPFCINWANENWTKRWDGLDSEVILKQNHSAKDDLEFIKDIEPILKDKRYIRVNGKPLLMVYRPALFPEIEKTVERWRTYCRGCGIGELYLVTSHAHEHLDPTSIGFDAATEFAPNTFQVNDISYQLHFYNANYQGHVYDYSSAIDYSTQMDRPGYQKFRSICPGWDNEARKPGKGISFHNASPHNYAKWLDFLLYDTERYQKGDEKIIFINAWNEWAEGAFLEPDRKHGYAYLNNTYQCLKKLDRGKTALLTKTQDVQKRAETAVVLHLYYIELWDEISEYLNFFGDTPVDLYINLNPECTIDEIEKIRSAYPKAFIFSYENRGRDILPFLHLFNIIYPLGYKSICKIHSKKSLHRQDGDKWRNELIGGLLGTPALIQENLGILENDTNTGIVVPKGNIYNYQDWIGSNNEMVEKFAKENNIQMPRDFPFPSGAMFWFKPLVFKQLYKNIDSRVFKIEQGQLDGTMAHSIERLFGLLCHANGYTLKESRQHNAL
jgi:lipopolysaccharide biosynthesis protein/ubiquinone/menaquinone biosynthesis C-methylase UbiE